MYKTQPIQLTRLFEQGILKKGEEKISITVSESERIIKISDNGTGVGNK